MSRRLYHNYDNDRRYSRDYSSNFANNRLFPLLALGAVIAAIIGIVEAFKLLFL